jgi:hypothetical protein
MFSLCICSFFCYQNGGLIHSINSPNDFQIVGNDSI